MQEVCVTGRAGSAKQVVATHVGPESLLSLPPTLAHRQAALEPRDQPFDPSSESVQLPAEPPIAAGLLRVDAAALTKGHSLHSSLFERRHIVFGREAPIHRCIVRRVAGVLLHLLDRRHRQG